MWSLHVARQRIAREDVLLFMNAARAGTAQEEFYEGEGAQSLSLDFLHEYMLVNYHELYARTLVMGLNHYNAGLVVGCLLSAGAPEDVSEREVEAGLIAWALESLPAPQAYKALRRLRQWGVNNARARQAIWHYLAERPDLPFHVIKYRGHIKALARHAHLRFGEETMRLLFKGVEKGGRFKEPIYEQFRRAHYSDDALLELPWTVAEGLAASRGVGRARLLEEVSRRGGMTRRERERVQDESAREGVEVEVDWGKASLMRLCTYILGMGLAERRERADELEEAWLVAGRREWSRHAVALKPGPVALVVDRSYSSGSSRARRNQPLALGLALCGMLKASGRPFETFWSLADECVERPIMVTAKGQSGLARPLLQALGWGASTVIIVSDGYENDPPGGVAAVLSRFWADVPAAQDVELLHLNPVMSAAQYQPKPLAQGLITLGIREAKELGVLLALARYVSGAAELKQLRALLDERVALLLAPMAERLSAQRRSKVLGP